ncbi:MAG: rhodanese-like domain-containing protein [Candidatus Binatia bacterium]
MTSGQRISHKVGAILFAFKIFHAAAALAGHGVEDTIDTLAAERVKQLMDAGEKLTFIDMRPVKEFQQTRLPGARSIPIAEVANRFSEIPKAGRVVLYCDCKTYDIADRAVFLEYRGYRNIFVMPEGYSGWVKRGYPVDSNRR